MATGHPKQNPVCLRSTRGALLLVSTQQKWDEMFILHLENQRAGSSKKPTQCVHFKTCVRLETSISKIC